ncbi:MAG: hypothetical protein INR62_01655 [Rhodospirillales bacterium]|nr:hypothetical protein [Acetobacter sp.]
MHSRLEADGQITYDLAEFCRDYGHPAGLTFTFEVISGACVYVYADVTGEVYDDQVVFDLYSDHLVDMRKTH